jgi:hypothetical protein
MKHRYRIEVPEAGQAVDRPRLMGTTIGTTIRRLSLVAHPR